jgi:outer membrane protein assembly factor BamB
MQKIKSKTMAIMIAFLLLSSVASSIALFPDVNAQQTQGRKTYPYIGATPNPVGIGQQTLLHVGITYQNAEYHGWEGLTVTVTKPDNSTETIEHINTDSTGGTGVIYVPTMVGMYYLQTHFPQQICNFTTNVAPAGTLFFASDSEKLALNVTLEPVPIYPGFALPTEYWTRPINSQMYEWSTIAGNWLATGRPDPPNRYAPYNQGPEAGHVLWTKQVSPGGIAGGDYVGELGRSFETGDAYEGQAMPPVVINGVLYYNRFYTPAGAGGGMLSRGIVAVDLHTGKELWFRNNTALSFGQVFYWDSFNHHGAYAYLWEVLGTTWNAYDAFTGEWSYTMTGVPAGTNIYGPNGEIYRYVVDLTNGWMALWNSSYVVQQQNRNTRNDGSWGLQIGDEPQYTNHIYPASRGIMWNKTIPKLPGTVKDIYFQNMLLGANVIDYQQWTTDTPVVLWALNLKPGQEGQLLYNTTWQPPGHDFQITYKNSNVKDGVFILAIKEQRQFYGFNLNTGQFLWGPSEPMPYVDNWDMFMPNSLYSCIVYGTLYSVGTGGECRAFNVTTGELMWTYDVKDFYSESLFSSNWPMQIAFVTDGKIYLFASEHCPKDPRWRGGPFVCLNATTGALVFDINMWGSYYGNHPVIADSIIATLNEYDNRLYAMGKGPSATTITASDVGISFGTPVTVKGTVTDISPGLQDYTLTSRFPNGVPAVSDESMSSWMEYVYMQFTKPANATGVEVTLSVVDANGNQREIGTTTSDAQGFYSFVWTPDISGKYTIQASFAGSKSFWPSQAETAFNVMEAPQTTPTQQQQLALPPTDMYLLGGVAAIIVAIAIVGVILLMVIKKRP